MIDHNQNINDLIKTPPHSIEAEQMLLGGIMLVDNSYEQICEIVHAHQFYRREHQLIFSQILKLKSSKRTVDAITVCDALNLANELVYVGGKEYIYSIVESTTSAANIKAYAEIIKERFILRELIKAGSEIVDNAFMPKGKDINILLDESEKKIFSIKDLSKMRTGFTDISSLLQQVVKRLMEISQRADKTAITGIATEFNELDRHTSGLQRGELIIVAGRPGIGKTSFALNIAENIAVKAKLGVVVFSLEMTGVQLVQRMISSFAKVDQTSMKRGDLSYDEMDKIYEAVSTLKHSQIYIAESPGINVIDLRARVRRLKDQLGDLGLVVIDYVQIMSGLGENRTNRSQEIAEISRSLKSLALELNVPIILLSQLNRDVEGRPDKRPNISDLRESGALEQDADIVLLLYRDDYYNPETSQQKGKAELNIAKNRSGSTGTIFLSFSSKYTRFDNLSALDRSYETPFE